MTPSITNCLRLHSSQKSSLDIVCEILKVYNCRAAEVLSARWKDFYPDDYLILNGVKHSCQIIIRDRIILQMISKLPKLNSQYIFPAVNYNRLYAHIRSNYNGLISSIKHKKNLKVTHAFRYKKVKNISNENSIREILHHRSKRSGKFYTNKVKD